MRDLHGLGAPRLTALILADVLRALGGYPELACPHCSGLGAVIREDARGRPFEWPCVSGCKPAEIMLPANARRR